MTAPFVNDTFTEASDTSLASHTPDSGGTWVRHTNFATNATDQASTDRVIGTSTAATSAYYHNATPPSANYDVLGTLRASNLSNGLPGILGRVSAAATTFYQLFLSSSTVLQLDALVAGSTVNSLSISRAFSINTDYKVILRMRGDLIEVLLNGAYAGVLIDTNISSAGFAGLRTRQNGSVDLFSGIDNSDVLVSDGIWTWFSKPRIVWDAANSQYYVGSTTASGSPRVDLYKPSTNTFRTFGLHDALEVDDHDNPAILILPSGKIAAFYSKHTSGNSYYRISTSAGSISAFDAEVNTTSGQTAPVSYSNPYYLPGPDKVALFYRSGTPGSNAKMALRTAANDLSSFDSEIFIAKGIADTDTIYWLGAQNGNDRVDFLVTDAVPNDAASSIYHFYAQWDGGSGAFKYYGSDGTEITATKPWRVNAQATQIYDGTSERAWIWDIRIDSNGRPRVLFTRFPSTTDHRYYTSKWNGSSWSTPVQIAAGGQYLYAAEPYYSGGASFDGNNPNIVYLSIESSGVWEIQEYRSSDDGASWSKFADITSGSSSSSKRARPYSPDGHEANLGVAYWDAVYTSYTSWSDATVRKYANDTALAKGFPFRRHPMLTHLAM